MINLANCNMYEIAAAEILETYAHAVDGTGREVMLAISENPLSEKATDALEKSAAALGYGIGHNARSCAHVVAASLDTDDLERIVEGLDPLVIVAADTFSTTLMSDAYRIHVEVDAASRVLGRTVVAFRDFEAMMDTPEEKQRAWSLLKKLNRL